jgi:hypothetical protein
LPGNGALYRSGRKGSFDRFDYLPNGNPQPGPKFDNKLAWFERLMVHAAELMAARRARCVGWRLQRCANAAGHLSNALIG